MMSKMRRGAAAVGLSIFVAACTSSLPAASETSGVPGTNPPLRTVAAATATPSPSPTRVTKPAADITLALSDAPAGFTLFADTARTIDDVAAGFADRAAGRTRLQELGFQASHGREFRKGPALFGLLGIVSSATVYASDVGARNGIQLNREQTSTRTAVREVSLGRAIGDESAAYTSSAKDGTGNFTLTTFYVYWRYANVSNSLLVVGVEGTTDVSAAIELAEKQLAKAKAT